MSRIVARATVFESPWLEVEALDVELDPPRGLETFWTVKTQPYVIVLAVTRDGRVPLVRLYRPAVDAVSLELPSGHVDAGEDAAGAARRELLEETGCRAGELIPLGSMFADSGRLQTRQEGFFAADVEIVGGDRASDEGIDVTFVEARHLGRLIAQSEIRHAGQLGVVAAAAARGYIALS